MACHSLGLIAKRNGPPVAQPGLAINRFRRNQGGMPAGDRDIVGTAPSAVVKQCAAGSVTMVSMSVMMMSVVSVMVSFGSKRNTAQQGQQQNPQR